MLEELRFHDGLHNDAHAFLHDAVSYSWNPKRPLFLLARLVDIFPPDFLRFEFLKSLPDVVDYPLVGFLELVPLHGFVINARSITSVIALDVMDGCNNSCFR